MLSKERVGQSGNSISASEHDDSNLPQLWKEVSNQRTERTDGRNDSLPFLQDGVSVGGHVPPGFNTQE